MKQTQCLDDLGHIEEWLRKWDAKLTRHNRKIALFIDNCSAHPRVQGLQSIELILFPPNTTSEIQPCDQGIIQALKVHYRKNMVKRLITAINSGSTAANFKITLLDGLQMLRSAWESVTESTISNCFRKGGFILPLEPEVEEEDPFVDLDAERLLRMTQCTNWRLGIFVALMNTLLLTIDSNVLPCQQIRTLYLLSCRSQKKTKRVTIQVIHYLQLLIYKPAYSAFQELRSYLLNSSQEKESESLLSDMESELFIASNKARVQTKITDYMNI